MQNNERVTLIDCPRDAIQGISPFISTQKKIAYINMLLDSELFDCIDFGSFVSHRLVPQMSDTDQVLMGLNGKSTTKLLAIIANLRGAEQAIQSRALDYIGFPFSISETFQKRNTNATIRQATETVRAIQNRLVDNTRTKLIIYLSMAFGNPYGDPWDDGQVEYWIEKLMKLGVTHFSLADTTGEANPDRVFHLVEKIKSGFSGLPFSVHLHSTVEDALLKIEGAYAAGCRQFEGAILGYGGCPFAKDDLVGNIPSELLVDRFSKGVYHQVAPIMDAFQNLITHEV
ncbi:MAG: hydroxymethylglutaryl-CoA lyase [Sphingobacterium sp.]